MDDDELIFYDIKEALQRVDEFIDKMIKLKAFL